MNVSVSRLDVFELVNHSDYERWPRPFQAMLAELWKLSVANGRIRLTVTAELSDDRLVTVSEAARITGKHRSTVSRWMSDGLEFEVGPNGRRRIRVSDLERFQ